MDTELSTILHLDLLRFLTCGSVDDGKSTLIGRLLHDTHLIYDDQLAAAKKDSLKHGTTGHDTDLALLVDGLRAEREQGITIDVAYRYFTTARRQFIVADCPGHEQYTRNMATGASHCDVAVILIDATKGLLPQTRRHSFIVSLLGIKHVIVAVNKMDQVSYAQPPFAAIQQNYADFATQLGFHSIQYVPLCALKGDTVVHRSERMSWYQGMTLLEILEAVPAAPAPQLQAMRFPVQLVSRPQHDFRGFAGTLAAGVIRRGDQVMVLPSQKTTRIKSILTYDGALDEAHAGEAITLTTTDEIDVSRGDMLVHPQQVPTVANDFDAQVVWLSDTPLQAGKEYLIKHTTRQVRGHIAEVRYAVDVNTLSPYAHMTLGLNQIGCCRVVTSAPLFFDAYEQHRRMGAFILIDRASHNTVGAGMIMNPSAGAARGRVTQAERQVRFGQHPVTVLLPSEALAHAVERLLFDEGRLVCVLTENNPPGAELLNTAGLIVLACGRLDMPEAVSIAPEASAEEVVALLRARGVIEIASL